MKEMLKRGREKVSGNKSELQGRLTTLLEKKRHLGQLEEIAEWLVEITGARSIGSDPAGSGSHGAGNIPKLRLVVNPQKQSGSTSMSLASRAITTGFSSNFSNGVRPQKPKFWESPFFQVVDTVFSKSYDCLSGRIDVKFRMELEHIEKLRNAHQLMLFVGPENGITGALFPRSGPGIPIEYPPPPPPQPNSHSSAHNCTVTVNSVTLPQASYLGMKGKPWTAKPADVSNPLHKAAGAINSIEMKVYPTSRRFIVALQMTKKVDLSLIIRDIVAKKTVSKQDVIAERVKRLHSIADDEVISTSQVVSLKDPISYCRIRNPSRSKTCLHVQCFDLETYLMMNDRIPTWTCPICSKYAYFEDLLVDGFFMEIVQSSEGIEDVESAEVFDEGEWKLIGETKDPPVPKRQERTEGTLKREDTRLVDDDRPENHKSKPLESNKKADSAQVDFLSTM
ncbi:SUMO ligase siz1 [Phlyctochytrium planicorne]|nr:SUMO ligase siz1 [Phlyctochytrium planicorne]